MGLGLSTSAITEIGRYSPRLTTTCELIKDYYGTQTVIDIEDDVVKYGACEFQTNLLSADWEPPSMSVLVKNHHDKFNPTWSDSYWQTSPAKQPEECVLRVRQYVITGYQTREKVFEFVGRVLSAESVSDEFFGFTTIEAVWEPMDKMNKPCTRRSGSFNEFDRSSGLQHKTNKPGISVVAPNVDVNYGFSTDPDFPHWDHDMSDETMIMETVWREPSTLEEIRPHIFHNASRIITTGTNNYKVSQASGGGTGWDLVFYNPPSYDEYTPSEIFMDFLENIAGVDSQFLTSVSSLNTYFSTTISPSRLLIAYMIDDTFAENALEILQYAPECAIRVGSLDSKLYMELIPKYSDFATPFEIKGISRVTKFGKLTSRLTNRMIAEYHSSVRGGEWTVEPTPTIGKMLRDGPVGRSRRAFRTKRVRGVRVEPVWSRTSPPGGIFKRDKTASGSLVQEEIVDTDLPWLSFHTTNYAARVEDLIDVYFHLWKNYPTHVSLEGTVSLLEVEPVDVVSLTLPRSHQSAKKFLVAAKRYDLDDGRVSLDLLDIEFTLSI